MGYNIPANSPQITIGTRTVAVAAWEFDLPIGGVQFAVGIYDLVGGAWNLSEQVAKYETAGALLADVQAKGGIVKYSTWIVTQVNAALATLFNVAPVSTPTPVPVEPTTDAEAIATVNALFASMKLTDVGGVPVLS